MPAESPRQEASDSTDASDKDFSCDYCEKSFESSPALNSHVGQVHEEHSKVTEECMNCGESVTKIKARMERTERTFCSHECHGEYQSGSMPYAAQDNDDYARETVSCDNCGEEHTRPRYRTKNRDNMYCSRGCHTEHILERGLFHDEDSPLYEQPADGEYGDNWDKVAKKVRKRDNYTCQACGKEQSSCNRKLDVHHIIPLRKFNDPKKANELNNLIALCRYCHNKWEGIPLCPQ